MLVTTRLFCLPKLNPLSATTALMLTTITLVLGLAGCAVKPHKWYDPQKAHHRPGGFANTNGLSNDKPISQLIRWKWEALRGGRPAAPSQVYKGYDEFPVIKPDLKQLAEPSHHAQATWIGHATVLLQLDGVNILTDPHFGQRASPLSFIGPKRRVRLPISLEELPHIDIVVISHNHYDHLDVETVRKLAEQPGGAPLFLVPLGVDAWFKALGVESVRAMDWWDQSTFRDVKVDFVPVQHWSARSLGDRNETLWGGWVIRAGGIRVFFAGDTGYSRDFTEIGQRFGGFDLALLPVGAYEPRWFMNQQHVNPDEAVKIHIDVKAKRSIGVHWGTFELTDEPLDQPIIDLAKAVKKYNLGSSEFLLLKHGELIEIAR